jgi:hypothetical protein
MGFPGKPVSMIRGLKRPFRMPVSRFVVASFIVFGGCTVGVRRKFVLLGGFPTRVVHVGLSSKVLSARAFVK